MTRSDTTLGGLDRQFPTTQWSQILGTEDLLEPEHRERLDAFLRAYWKPAFAYIRTAWHKSNEDAKDLTQEFFTRLLQNGRLGAVGREGGRFRNYLKQALRNFLINTERAEGVRRPVEPVLSLDFVDREGLRSMELPAPDLSPEQVFDQEWLSSLLRESLEKLEEELRAADKEKYLAVFQTYLFQAGGPTEGGDRTVIRERGDFVLPTYASVAHRLGIQVSDVRNYLAFCRARLREHLRTAILKTVEDAREAEAELPEPARTMKPEEEWREKLKWFLAVEPDDPGEAPVLAPAILASGRRIGHYRLMEMLGEGGTGIVFRAVDEDLGREVALKMLKTALSFNTTQMERFMREARNTARLRHPGIVTLHEIGRDEDSVYLVLELIQGRPFNPRQGSLQSRVALLEQVARAVHHAHERGVVHRDLKPRNIVVDAEGAPHLLDFGLSRDMDAPGDLTRSGGFFGTPSYTAPEQAKGRVGDVDPRVDVYSLGTILYEILSGTVPFSGGSMGEVLHKVITEDPATPAGPVELQTICLKAMEKKAARRYASAGAMADDLARYLRGESISAKPASWVETFGRVIRRHRRVLLPDLIMLLLGALAGIWFAHPRGPKVAVLEDFEDDVAEWKLVRGSGTPATCGELGIDDSVAHGGQRSYRLQADFSHGGREVGGYRSLDGFEPKEFRELRLWVKAQNVKFVTFRLDDFSGGFQERDLPLQPTSKWQEVILRYDPARPGAIDKGSWKGPAKGFGFRLRADALADPKAKIASLWIDDLVVFPVDDESQRTR